MSSYSDFANAASDILLKKGEAAARAKEQGGQLWGSTIANLGQVVPQQVQAVMQQVAAKKKTAQIQSIIQQNGGDLEKSLPLIMGIDATLGAHLADEHAKVQKSIADVQEIQQKAKKAELDYSDRLWSQVTDESSYAHAAMVDKALGGTPLDHYDPDWVKQKKQSLLSMKDQLDLNKPIVVGGNLVSPQGAVIYQGEPKVTKPKTWAEMALDAQDTESPTHDASVAALAAHEKIATPKAVTPGSFEDFIVKKYGAEATPDQILAARKAYGQADDRPPAVTVNMAGDDVNAIADAIIRGDQPPELTGLYRNAGPVRAALARKGYDQSTALTDWRATQKHVATLNGAQQTRMAQAIDNAAHSLDVIEGLADQWDGGKFPPLNKARLALAKNGALGPKAQQIATNLEAQISDVTSELGNVYMGGNSPTDHALGLAAKNLSADWTKEQLRSALKLARTNLQIRTNSMRNVGVAGASAGNPYAAPTAPAVAPPTGRYNPKTGKVE